MARANIPLSGGLYRSDSLPVSHQEAVNLYPSLVQAAGYSQEVLFPTPGISQITPNDGATNEENRGATVLGDVPYFVQKNTLYSLDRTISLAGVETFDVTAIGTIEGSGRVSMADNGTQVCILVPGGKGYILTQSGGFGANLVLNGGFSSSAEWTTGLGWSITETDGFARLAASAVDAELSQTVPITAAKTYKLTYDIGAPSAGGIQATITPTIGGVTLTPRTSAGTFEETFVADSSTALTFTGTNPGGDDVWIDNVKVQEQTAASALEEITDPDFRANGNPQSVVFIDGYFLFTTDEKKHIVSSLNDGLNYNALDFGSAEADPDDIVAPIVFKNQLFIAGTQTIEGFQNVGGADYPFQRTGVFIEKGIAAPFSAINANQTFLFVGSGENESPAIWEFQGNSVAKISTTAIDSMLQNLTDSEVENIFAWAYAQKGAYFVGFTLPHTTIVYDTISQRWHERKTYEVNYLSTDNTDPYRVSTIVEAYGRVLVGDTLDGRIGELDTDVFTEYGDTVTRRFTSSPLQNNGEAFYVPMVEMTVESGVGNDTESDPLITLFWSSDGRTWSGGRSRSMGSKGEYGHRCIWRRNGRFARGAVMRFEVTEPVKCVFIQLVADVEIGGA